MAEKTTLVRLAREKETPGTVRFREQVEEGEPEVLKTLYVQKWWAGSAEELEVQITKTG